MPSGPIAGDEKSTFGMKQLHAYSRLLFARSHSAGGVGTFKMPLPQNDLATRFRVTRESIARALGRLEDNGLLVKHKNSRWTVRKIPC